MSEENFDRAFHAQLSALDPAKVYADLGSKAILLCYEPPGAKCHRFQVAAWLGNALCITIPEFSLLAPTHFPWM